MMQFIKGTMLCTIVAVSLLYGIDPIFSGSNVFTFPTMTGIKTQHVTAQQPPFFRSSTVRPNSKVVTFSWYFPAPATKNPGTITVYSLLGRVVAKMPVQTHSGTVTWNLAASPCKSGVYIVRINYGVNRQNLKLMLWN
jgi:hypothetical protein